MNIIERNNLKSTIKYWKQIQTKDTFVNLMTNICNENGCYADNPKNTKKFWYEFTLECIDNGLIAKTNGVFNIKT